MRANEFVTERKKYKRKSRGAAYGPGPYGGYGYYAGYSGDSGAGGDGGGESIKNEDAMMGKIADSGKIIRILKKAHTVPFSDEKNWLLVDMDPAKGNSGLGIKWIPADTRFEWVRPYRDTVDENFADGKNPQDKGDVEPISTNEVVVIGDSIAVGIGGAGPYAKGGISTAEVLNRVNAFIKTGKAKGSVVILSSGASNSAPVEIEGGATQPGNLAPIDQQLAALKAAGASVALVGTGSKNSVWFPPTKYTNGKRYRIDLTGVNQQLASMASANGAKFLGPLEDYDSGMHSGKGDGVHPFSAYQKLKQTGSAIAPSRIKPSGAASSRIKPAVGADHVDSTVTSNTGDNMGKAKQSAEQFLGRRINNEEWVRPYRDTVDENFADGKNPQDKGDSKRHGVNTKGSISSLRKTAKQGGRKGQLAHWMANMKSGQAKKK